MLAARIIKNEDIVYSHLSLSIGCCCRIRDSEIVPEQSSREFGDY